MSKRKVNVISLVKYRDDQEREQRNREREELMAFGPDLSDLEVKVHDPEALSSLVVLDM